MARILYGVHGTARGHAVRALTVARHFPEHEFLFVTHGQGTQVLAPEFPVVEIPGLLTVFRNHKVAMAATVWENLKILLQSPRLLSLTRAIIERFQPDVALSDYEFFVPQSSRQAGLACLSLDHQHVLTLCRHPVCCSQAWGGLTTRLVVRLLFSEAHDYLVTSFYRPPVKPGAQVHIVPPLLRESVLARRPAHGGHVVVYQSTSTFERFVPFLRHIPRPVMVYGFQQEARGGNLVFKRYSEKDFLDDLASCSYVICGGGHTLMSEALYFGKPVLSFPRKNDFEQFLNAFYLERLGYGHYSLDLWPGPEILRRFEARLDQFRANLADRKFCGNAEIFALLECFIREKTLNLGPSQASGRPTLARE
jgi:uncharacterized protein (TIGR00661 family)